MAESHPRERLLTALSQNGRASLEALARSTDLPTAVVRQCLRELADTGVQIRGIVHPSVFGQHALAHVLIDPTRSAAATIDVLMEMPEIPYITRVAGEFSIAAEVRVADRAALARMIETITAMPEVRRLHFDEYGDIVKDAMVRMHGTGKLSLSPTDRILLRELQRDGRAPYAALAREVDLTTAAARARVLRLIESGVIHIGIRTKSGDGMVQVGFGLFGTPSNRVVEALLPRASIEYLATSIGRSNVIGTIRASSLGAVSQELDAIQAVPGVSNVSSWTHLEIAKEHYETGDPTA